MFPQVRISSVENLPIRIADTKYQQEVVRLVDKVLDAKERNLSANTTSIERQIDILVYHLYNFTYEEAKVIDPALTEEEFDR